MDDVMRVASGEYATPTRRCCSTAEGEPHRVTCLTLPKLGTPSKPPFKDMNADGIRKTVGAAVAKALLEQAQECYKHVDVTNMSMTTALTMTASKLVSLAGEFQAGNFLSLANPTYTTRD